MTVGAADIPAGPASRSSPGMRDFIAALPKVELHVHLEGAIQPATLLRLAARRGVTLPANDEAGLREWFRFSDFEHFVQIYLTCSRCLRDPEDFQSIVEDFLAAQARQNVVYCEAYLTISTHVANGANGGEVLDAIADSISEGEARHGVRLRLIPDIVRNVGIPPANLTLEWALAGQQRGVVVALGLSGSEALYPCEPFAEHFREAERCLLPRVAHAGEHAGPVSVRAALATCHPARIGHGVRSVEDPALLDELVARGIPLEVCPTSNLCLGVAADLQSHPLDRLLAAGVPLSINSDDPTLFATTLGDELVRLWEKLGYGPERLAGLELAALGHAFLAESEKAAWGRELRQQIAELAERHLGARIEPEAFPA